MKKFILILITSLLTNIVWSQVIFNNIIEDTIAHIVSDVIALDTGFIITTGTGNQEYTRSFSFQHINDNGDKTWKKIFDFPNCEVWEGYENSLKKNGNSFCNTGIINSLTDNSVGVFINIFDTTFTIVDSAIIEYDTIFKRSFNQIKLFSNDYYIIGQMHDYDIESGLMLVVKLDENLNTVWLKTYGQRYEYGEQIIETSDKKILIGGGTFSFPTTVTDEDWYLIKLDTAGNVIWEKGFGKGGFLNYDGPVRGLIESSDSNYIACGGYPALRDDTDTYWDGCIRKVSKDGELMWENFYRMYTYYRSDGKMKFYNKLTSIISVNDSDMLVLGSSYGSYPQQRGFLMKVNNQGQIKWCKHYYAIDSTSRDQYLVSVKETQDKGFVLAGYGNDYDTFGYEPPQQAWLVKTDSLGLDGLCYTETPELNFDIEIPETVCANDTIQIYVNIAGKSAPYTIEFSTGQIIDSIYYPPTFVPVEIGLSFAEIDYAGEIIYSEQITEATLSNHEWGQCIAKPVEFYAPQFYGTHNIDITISDAYGESKTITKNINFNDCGDLVEQENTCPVKLYPNPLRDKLYLDIPETISVEYAEIFNSVGQIVKTIPIHKGLNVVDVSSFASGNYIVKIIGSEESYSLSFEKE